MNGVKPTSYVDALALTHDINYLIATGDAKKLELADNIAIKNSPYFSLQGLTMKLGLSARKYLHLKENEGVNNKIYLSNMGYKLKNKINNDPYWADILKDIPKDSFLD
jgi:hypothetical protein